MSGWLLSTATDKRDDETWSAYWARRHDRFHGSSCGCAWNVAARRAPLLAYPGAETMDTVPEGKRLAVRR